ncbi:MAG: hypothetical protein A2937_01650 [Candidatus Yonathbacteria bacterium RIFCSPLOWO2_01_FULL_47_33b]|uniref:Uncharacterized protein n=1 Tax=Candidatus Yonathbacteria bacterium RIFCSPLOWO2_01_FULL_47_33b TaxID=1802727 RepID=A0A1G2SHE3_9BACT|nr:MAG: hypothetical protein A2937_01650 [Candidatus Yonathbacteria bacterium RIFCSPLOWO2_01_FULL_47_33b]
MIKPILSLIVIVFSIAFGVFYSKPAYDDIKNARADIEKLDKTAQSTSEIKDIIEQTGKSLSAVDADDLARFDVFLPETLDGIRFANNLQHIGSANGLILSDIKVEQKEKEKTQEKSASTQPTPGTVSKVLAIDRPIADATTPAAKGGTEAKEKFLATKASFTFATTYSGFLLFLNDMEKSLGLINITSLSFKELAASGDEKATQKGVPPLYQFNIEIETYSLK